MYTIPKKAREKFQKEIEHYNRKVTKLQKKVGKENAPEKLNYSDIMFSINDKDDFHSWKKIVKTLDTKNSEKLHTNKYGVSYTKGEEKRLKIETDMRNRNILKSRKKHQIDLKRNMTEDEKRFNESKLNENMENTVDFNLENKTKQGMEYFKKRIRKKSEMERDKQYKRNYLRAVKNTVDDKNYEKIKKTLKDISPSDMLIAHYNDLTLRLKVNYVGTQEEMNNRVNLIIDSWNKFKEDLKEIRK